MSAASNRDPSDEAAAALIAAVHFRGEGALSDGALLDGLLHDLLPDHPDESRLVVSGAEVGVARVLNAHLAEGHDVEEALDLSASTLAALRPGISPDDCRWVVRQFALASGHEVGGVSPPAPLPIPPATVAGLPEAGAAPAAPSGAAGAEAGGADEPAAAPPEPPEPPEPAGPPPAWASQMDDERRASRAAASTRQPPPPLMPRITSPLPTAEDLADPEPLPPAPKSRSPLLGRTFGRSGARPPIDGSHRKMMIAALVGAVITYGLAAAFAKLPPFAKSGSGGSTATSTTLSPAGSGTTGVGATTPPQSTQAPGSTVGGSTTASLAALMPDQRSTDPAGNLQTSGCTTPSQLPAGLTGVTASLACTSIPGAAGWDLFGYQFDSSSDFDGSLVAYEDDKGFSPGSAGPTCPAPAGQQGLTSWSSATYPANDDQVVECFSTSGGGSGLRTTYLWTLPTKNAFFELVGAPSATPQQVAAWWNRNGQPGRG